MNGYDDIRTFYQIESLYSWTHNREFPPTLVEICPTHRCNQKCRYCYADKGGKSKEILTNDALINCFVQVANYGTKAILIQGTGEPLLHKALPEAIENISKYQLSIGLVTNGVLLNNNIQEKILKHLLFIKFSVVDIDSKRYGHLHGCSETQLKNLINNIKNAIRMRKTQNLQLGLWASVYVENDNFDDIYNIVEFYKNLGLDYIIVQEATYTNLSPSGKRERTSSNYSEQEIREFKEKILTLKDDDFNVKIRFPIDDVTYNVGSWKKDSCDGIKFYTLISSDGEVYPCWRLWGKKDYSYGNIYKNTFDEIWKGETRKKIENFINTVPPHDDECSVCNIGKLNKILNDYKKSTKWKDFLI